MIRPITRATVRILLMLGITLLSWQAQASLNGKPVVLIHGFQYQQLGTQPTDASLQAASKFRARRRAAGIAPLFQGLTTKLWACWQSEQ